MFHKSPLFKLKKYNDKMKTFNYNICKFIFILINNIKNSSFKIFQFSNKELYKKIINKFYSIEFY